TTTAGVDLGHGTVTGSQPALPTETVTGTLGVTGTGITYTPQDISTTFGLFKLNSDGTYTYTLTSPVTSSPAANDGTTVPTNGHETITYTATDANGNTVSGTVTINIQDDVPTAVSALSLSMADAVGSASAYLDTDHIVANNMGADGGKVIFTAATITSLQTQALTSGLASLNYSLSADGTVLTATKSTDSSLVFTIELQPIGSPDQYVVTIAQPVDSISTVDFNGGGYQFVGGNGAWAGFTPTGEPVTGTDNNSHDLLLTPAINHADAGTINASAISGGVGSGNSVGLDSGTPETFRVDFVIDLRGDPGGAGGFGDPTTHDFNYDSHYNTNGASALFTATSGSTVNIAAFQDPDGNTVVGDGTKDGITQIVISYDGVKSSLITVTTTTTNYTVNGHIYGVTLQADGSVNVSGVYGTSGAGAVGTQIAVFTDTVGTVDANPGYNSLEFTYVAGDTFKIGDFAAAVVSTNPVVFTAPISVKDGDGDTVTSGNLSITLNPPVVLDTNHDGVISYLGVNDGVHYDYNGDGNAEATAWVAAGDSILVRDANHDGTVTNSSEFVFGGNGVTDMQALAAQYGSTLDAKDADFSQFMVWNDANSNGIADAGELKSLAAAGITSISLVSDGVATTAANGDVQVAGSSTFTYVNDNGQSVQGKVDDAAFAYKTVDSELELRLAASANGSGVVAAAVAAMGLAASQAAVHADSHAAPGLAQATDAGEFGQQAAAHASVASSAGAGNHSLIGSEHWSPANESIQPMGSTPAHDLSAVIDLSLNGAHGAQISQPATLLATAAAIVDTAHSMVNIAPALVFADAGAKVAVATASGGVQHGGEVAKVLTEAIEQSGPSIDAVLAHLPANGAAAALQALASHGGDAVPAWDNGHFGGFTPEAIALITTEAMVLHHDAVQPAVNG
ncbi:MAG: VCBS domain-containing protein, partial [Sphingomicrobium sp.]